MNNYEYIIASLPLPGETVPDADGLLEFIRSQCSEADCRYIDCITEGFRRDALDEAFYAKALVSKNAFVCGFLLFDLQLRNTKVEYLNKALGRPEGMDILPFPGVQEGEEAEFEARDAVMEVLEQDDILSRERGLDALLWDKADELTHLHLFDMDVILSFIAKLMITERWNKLDEQTGREMFRRLVDEIRKTR